MGAVLVVVIVLIVLLLGILVVSGLRRRDLGTAIGELSRETRHRDASATRSSSDLVGAGVAPATTGKAVERAAVVERRGGAIEVAPPATPAPYVAPDPETVGISRRQFFNRSIVGLMSLALAGFGGSVLAFLWPRVSGGFGSAIRVGTISEVRALIQAGDGFLYRPDGRMWITEYPAGSIEKARAAYSQQELAGMEVGLLALYQKCPHLGCRVPECATSQWFECGCHGSQYNRVGEKRGGPAPRGMDRFAMEVDGDTFVVNTGIVIPGPPIGVNTTGQEAEGPHCVTGAGGH
jgi:cytochrome b6-f complex iron-sulfur subunit